MERNAWAVLVLAVGIGCTGPAARRTLSTARLEVGASDETFDTTRVRDVDGHSTSVAVSIQPFAALEMKNERDRDEELAQSIAYATATRAPSTPPPVIAGKATPDSVDGGPAAVSTPWYLSALAIACFGVAILVGVVVSAMQMRRRR